MLHVKSCWSLAFESAAKPWFAAPRVGTETHLLLCGHSWTAEALPRWTPASFGNVFSKEGRPAHMLMHMKYIWTCA